MPQELAVTTPSDREIRLTRTFKAPREAVFDAMLNPKMVRQWLSPPDWRMTECSIDPQSGYRYVWTHDKGHTMGMRGDFLEIVRPERIVQTEQFDQPWYPGAATGTLELSETGGITTLQLTVRYESREARDGVLQTPMAQGVAAGYNALEMLL